MEGIFEILLEGRCIGQAVVKRDGLYYDFACRCNLKNDMIYKLLLILPQKYRILGTPAPDGHTFLLRKKLPVKCFSDDVPSFCAVPGFIPIVENQPFHYLNLLSNAILTRYEGKTGIILRE